MSSGVSIKGNAEDDAVLCTKNKTYAIKQAETSNTLLLIPGREVRKSHAHACKHPFLYVVLSTAITAGLNVFPAVSDRIARLAAR